MAKAEALLDTSRRRLADVRELPLDDSDRLERLARQALDR